MVRWKVIGSHCDYEVSDTGLVRSWKPQNQYSERPKCPSLISQNRHPDGYMLVHLYEKGKRHCYKVHQLVACAFIENPDNLLEVNHEDEDKSNNHYLNLKWCDRQYNQEHSFGKEISLLSPDGDIQIYPSIRDASRSTGLDNGALSRLVRGIYKHTKGWTIV